MLDATPINAGATAHTWARKGLSLVLPIVTAHVCGKSAAFGAGAERDWVKVEYVAPDGIGEEVSWEELKAPRVGVYRVELRQSVEGKGVWFEHYEVVNGTPSILPGQESGAFLRTLERTAAAALDTADQRLRDKDRQIADLESRLEGYRARALKAEDDIHVLKRDMDDMDQPVISDEIAILGAELWKNWTGTERKARAVKDLLVVVAEDPIVAKRLATRHADALLQFQEAMKEDDEDEDKPKDETA